MATTLRIGKSKPVTSIYITVNIATGDKHEGESMEIINVTEDDLRGFESKDAGLDLDKLIQEAVERYFKNNL